jgi:hypothetical protein
MSGYQCPPPSSPPAAPTPNEQWNLTSTIPFQGIVGTGNAYVYYAVGHSSLVNPLIISEGFPGGQSLDHLWATFNNSGFATSLLSLGYDVIFLGYPAPGAVGVPTYIEANSGVAIACIQQAISQAPANAQLVVGGASMGGLVTRYALAYMETNNMPHNTLLYFSFDTPHLGATIPASVLYFVNYFYTAEPATVQSVYNLLQSPAAQEMLLYWLPPGTSSTPTVSSYRTQFLQNLINVGNFPKLPYKRIGVANGNGIGSPNATQPASLAFSWTYDQTFKGHSVQEASASLYSAPGGTAGVIPKPNTVCKLAAASSPDFFRWNYQVPPSPTPDVTFDNAPGGRGDYFCILYDTLVSMQGSNPSVAFGQSCFIPTISALAMSTLDPTNEKDLYTNISQNPQPSLLDAYTYSSSPQSDPHVTFTPQLAGWLYQQILENGPIMWQEHHGGGEGGVKHNS